MDTRGRFRRLTDIGYLIGLGLSGRPRPPGSLPKVTLSGGLPDTYEEMKRGIALKG